MWARTLSNSEDDVSAGSSFVSDRSRYSSGRKNRRGARTRSAGQSRRSSDFDALCDESVPSRCSMSGAFDRNMGPRKSLSSSLESRRPRRVSRSRRFVFLPRSPRTFECSDLRRVSGVLRPRTPVGPVQNVTRSCKKWKTFQRTPRSESVPPP